MAQTSFLAQVRARLRRSFADVERWHLAVMGVVAIGVVWLYWDHPPGEFTNAGRIHSDGVYHYMYLRSLVFDRDFDFTNDYAILGNPFRYPDGPNGIPVNRFTVGAAILWMPFFAVGQGLAWIGNHLGWFAAPLDGSSHFVQRWTLFGSAFWGWAAAWTMFATLRRHTQPSIALFASVAAVVASPLLWYMTRQPSWPHAASAFCVAVFVNRWDRCREDAEIADWVWLGAALGLAMLVRPQNAVLVLLPLASGSYSLWTSVRNRDRASERHPVLQALLAIVVFYCATALLFTPQMWAWQRMYGTPLLVPQGDDFMRWGASRWDLALFSSRGGLFAWHPWLWICTTGLALGAAFHRLGDSMRPLAAGLLAVFALTAYINGATADWWGGWAFGGRRFVGMTAAFAVGGAIVLGWIARLLEGRQLPQLLLALAVAWLGYSNLHRMREYLHGDMKHGVPQDLLAPTERAVTAPVRQWHEWLGNPGSIPANWWFAWQTGVSPGRYDEVAGWELLRTKGANRSSESLSPSDRRFFLSEIGDVHTRDGSKGYAVSESPVRFSLPLREPFDLGLRIRLHAPRAGSFAVVVNDRHVLDTPVVVGWHDYQANVVEALLDSGMNVVALDIDLIEREPADLTIGRTSVVSPMPIGARVVGRPDERHADVVFGHQQKSVDIRGLHLASVDPSGTVKWYGPLEIGRNRSAAAELAHIIEREQAGAIIVLVGFDQRFPSHVDIANAALQSIGAELGIPSEQSWSYALVGVKGARAGEGLESVSVNGLAMVELGTAFESVAMQPLLDTVIVYDSR